MIGNFARMHRDATPRVLAEDEPAPDAPPERFVQKVDDEAGPVFLSPIVEALRDALRARRGGDRDASRAAPETTTRPARTERA